MIKKIKFIPGDKFSDLTIPSPELASKNVPSWYKNLEKPDYKNPKFNNNSSFGIAPIDCNQVSLPANSSDDNR
jgi:hypothetical protein